MKKKSISRIKLILIYTLIYIIVLIFGLLLCLGITYAHSHHTPYAAMEDMQYYLEHREFSPNVQIHSAHNYVYAPDGSRVDYSVPDIDSKFDIDNYVSKQFHEIPGNEPLMKLIFHPNLPKHFAITVAIPMEDGGLFLFLRELSIHTALVIIFISATIMLVLSAIFTLLIMRNNLKTEKIQQEYVANISHELKSPIASVRALTETIRDGLVETREQQEEYCDIMLHELYTLEHTVTNMLELSKIQSMQINCQKDILSATDVFCPIINKYAALCYEMGIEFQLLFEWRQCPPLHTNSVLASRMLDILLDNALKYSKADGKIQLQIKEKHNKIIVVVTDTGPGIAPEDQPHIFSRFYKGNKEHNPKGSGLGLAIANEIALCLNERIWLSKTSPSGSEFSFTIDIAK